MSSSGTLLNGYTTINLTKFGHTLPLLFNKNVDLGSWPLISPFTYTSTLGALSALAFGVGIGRLILRVRRYGRWDRDDSIFSAALLCLVLSTVFNIYCSDFFYLNAEISVGAILLVNPQDIVPTSIRYLQIMNGITAVQWVAIYSVKLCYLMFFHKLTSRVKPLRIWWWITMAITVPSLFVTCFSGLVICSDFSDNILATCSLFGMFEKAVMVTKIDSALDIVTDVMIVSIPMLLLARVKINRTRKITIATILSLSLVMVVVAIVRLFPPSPGVQIFDTTWFFFWMGFETAISIIMVSITAFRGIFQGTTTRGSGEASPTPNSFLKLRQRMSSQMGKFFVWSSRAGSTTLATEAPRVPRKDTIKNNTAKSFFFQWETNLDTIDDKSSTDSATLGMPTRSWPPSVKSGSLRSTNSRHDDLVSLPSMAFSPLSTMNQSISPMSTQQDRSSKYYNRF